MLFRTINGELIEINKHSFKNDKLYYTKIMEIKTPFIKQDCLSKLKKTLNDKNY